MKRVLIGGLLMALAAGAGYLVMTWRVEVHYDEQGRVAYLLAAPKDGPVAVPQWPVAETPAASEPRLKALRVASFRLADVDHLRLVAELIARVVPQFQIVALQGLRGQPRRTLVRLVEVVNQSARAEYHFAVAEPNDPATDRRYCAFVFDPRRVQIDRSVLHQVTDAAGRLSCPALVGLFRARGPLAAEAFTFKLISVDVSAEQAAVELELLDEVFRTERDDGLGEDDVILLGHLAVDERHLGPLADRLDLGPAVTGLPTTVRGGHATDNILFDLRATTEFTGRAGVVDISRELDMPVAQVALISCHLPVWAEFSAFEGRFG